MIPYVGFGGPGATISVSGGIATTTLNGLVYLDVAAFSSDPISSVELWSGESLVYAGSPTVLARAASFDGSTRTPLRVVATSSTGTVADETYSDVAVTRIFELVEGGATDVTTTVDSNSVRIISPANATVTDGTSSGDANTCLLVVPASVAGTFLLAASFLLAVLYDTASADTGSFADTVAIAQRVTNLDAATGADSSLIALTVPNADGTASSDATAAAVGYFAASSDTSTASDTNAIVVTFRAAVSDSTAASDTNAVEQTFPETIAVTDTTGSADACAIVSAIGTADASTSSDIAYAYVGQFASGADLTASADDVGVSITTGTWIPPAKAPRIKLVIGGPTIRLKVSSPAIDLAHAGGPTIRLSLLEEP